MKLYHADQSTHGPAAALRWGAAGLVVAGLHLVAGWWIVSHPLAAPPAQARGIPIDLEPVAIPQTAPEPDAATAAGPAPAPQAATAPELVAPADATPPPPSDPLPTVAEAQQPAQPPATTEPPRSPEVEPPATPDVPAERPIPPKAVMPEALLSPPQPPPRPKAPPQPDPRALVRDAAKRKALAERRAHEQADRQEARALAKAQAKAAREAGGAAATASAPGSVSSGADVASWRGAVLAHLNAFKPPAAAAPGTARVAFAVDRSGRVTGASLAASSGDPQLDQMAVAMVRRASPVPAPPPELGGHVNLTVPVRFH